MENWKKPIVKWILTAPMLSSEEYQYFSTELERLESDISNMMMTHFITISFDDKSLPLISDVPSLIRGRLNKVYISKYIFNLEQRSSSSGKYSGLHTHILIRVNGVKAVSHIRREFYNSFKKYVENIKYIDVKKLKKDNGVLDYMRGLKSDPAKQDKVKNDKLMREEYNLNLLYESAASVDAANQRESSNMLHDLEEERTAVKQCE